ncbi:superoxide dismutase family protein [Alkalicoccobacillus porphyridii]|uniref:Superoxide dismutase [Cu-Zn] n=1 Tax=Alkalicoccobacillus porphyridii TaxID=2597270 RepID=A0A554A3I5_9BACI|nr:superoxide dismutase family protein [Alkalicoccobacillus porphyridii]TSB48254.1 hypothetical protein FN960_01495 [Alkalicoccobacillus porphyridii]
MKMKLSFLMILSVILVACGSDEEAPETGAPADPPEAIPETEDEEARAELMDDEGNSVGLVSFLRAPDGNLHVEASVNGLGPGFHGFHIHEAPACDHEHDEGAFTSAEGHYDQDGNSHGDHAGDMPALFVNEDGTAQMTFSFDRVTTEELIDETTVMVHADPDNYGHIPDRYQSDDQEEPGPDEESLSTGDAGDRVACGVVESPQ